MYELVCRSADERKSRIETIRSAITKCPEEGQWMTSKYKIFKKAPKWSSEIIWKLFLKCFSNILHIEVYISRNNCNLTFISGEKCGVREAPLFVKKSFLLVSEKSRREAYTSLKRTSNFYDICKAAYLMAVLFYQMRVYHLKVKKRGSCKRLGQPVYDNWSVSSTTRTTRSKHHVMTSSRPCSTWGNSSQKRISVKM